MKLLFITCLVLALAQSPTRGQPVPRITTLSREWFERGTTNELTISGENLHKVQSVHVSGESGLTFALVPRNSGQRPVEVEATRGGISAGEVEDGKSLRVRVVASADAALGARELRIVASAGISNPLLVSVSPIAEIVEHPGDMTLIHLPVGISGTINAPGETDSFRFKAMKGEDLIAEVFAFRAGSPLDSSLVIYGRDDRELARSEDAKGFDSFLHFRVPEDGEYVLRLRDFRYEGGSNYRYHLTVGAIPYIDSAYPLGARRGESVEVQLRGVNLGEVKSVTLTPEANAPLGWQEVRVRTPGGLSTPFPFCVADLPEVLESEPNNLTNQANRVTVPATINGRIGAQMDVDRFSFKPDRTETLVCEVTAQRLGSPLDALLTLEDAGGKLLQQNDDAEGADARIEFTFQKGQEYRLTIRDLLGRGGEDFCYRLAIRPPQPDFVVRLSPDAPRIQCGTRSYLQVEISRLSGFAEAVQLAAQGLPAGLACAPVLLTPDGPNQVLMTMEAAENAVGGAYPFQIIGTAVIGGKRVSHPAEPMADKRAHKEALVAVLDAPAPFRLDLLALSLSLEQEQSEQVEVVVERRNGFAQEIKLVLDGFGAGQSLEAQPVTLKVGEPRAVLKLKVKADAEPGTHPIYVRGEAALDGTQIVEYSQAIPLHVREVPFTLLNTMKRLSVTVLAPGVQSAASEAEFAVRASRRGWFTDQISLALEGLPEGITATTTNLPNHVAEAGFKLNATSKAPVGKEVQITVVGSATVAGRTYRERTAPLTLSIAAPQEVADSK